MNEQLTQSDVDLVEKEIGLLEDLADEYGEDLEYTAETTYHGIEDPPEKSYQGDFEGLADFLYDIRTAGGILEGNNNHRREPMEHRAIEDEDEMQIIYEHPDVFIDVEISPELDSGSDYKINKPLSDD